MVKASIVHPPHRTPKGAVMSYWSLTGRARYRNSLFGKLILQLEMKAPHWSDSPGIWQYKWRDAKLRDLRFSDLDIIKIKNVLL
jgi:hypothetical protein